ncbi:MAG: hypothetical protein INR73_14350 [Williamsia sp.]|nr:hypothetical protein [Williamsia sp.]
MLVLAGCSNQEQEADTDIYNNLELNGKINTFPLCVVLSDKLDGNDFPADLKELCSFSKTTCKTLPIAGILRSGADIYYTYNCFADLKIPAGTGKDEAGITQAVEKQVADYYSTTKLKEYDSLLTPNLPDWNIRNLPAMYISNTSDSVFFYSNQPGHPSSIQVGYRTYPVYTSVADLRKDIDALICKRYEKVAVFYNPVFMDSANRPLKPLFAARGKTAGDSCLGSARWEKLHDGTGGFMLGRLLEKDSKGCGFVAPPPAPSIATRKPDNNPDQAAQIPTSPVRKKPEPAAPVASSADPAFDGRADNARTDYQCFRRSEPVCEQDDNKNFTGRRVQYCYNRAGQVVRTIVISKCEADCRCF